MKLRDDPDFPSILAMLGCAVIGMAVMAACVLLFLSLPGCGVGRMFESTKDATVEAIQSTSDSPVNLGILNVVFVCCIVAAVATVVAGAWFPVPKKTTAALVACAIGSAVLHVVLAKYLWLVILLSSLGLVLAAVAWFLAHREWLEERSGIDLNRDGKIGTPTQETPL